jgi:hypothetical protein
MSIRVTSLDDLSPTTVEQLFAEFKQLMVEKHPEIELTRGVFHDLVLYFSSVFGAVDETNIQKVLDSRSLLAIQNDPTLADPELVDHILSNYLVTRAAGNRAAGEVTIVVNSNEVIVVPDQLTFEASGVQFQADAAFTGRPLGTDLPNATDRALQPRGDGTYAFTISATAKEEGVSGNIRRGTKMVPQALLPRFVTAFAANDFTDGFAAETNTELLNKLVLGVAAKSTSGRLNLTSFIKNQVDFQRTLAYSIIGMADPEMQRDQHSILPISGGGRVDVYARTSELPQSTVQQVTAVLIAVTPNGSTWQFTLDKTFAPGFYEVERIALPDAGDTAGYEVTMDARGYDVSAETGVPDIQSIDEAAYSKYQTAVIQFLDTDTVTTGLSPGTSTAIYEVAVLAMPQIAELQDLLSDRSNRHRMADTLVRGAIPCFLQVHFTIRRQPGDTIPDTDGIKQALATRVNTLGFSDRLHASTLTSVVHDFLSSRQALSAIDMLGRIRRPDGSFVRVHATEILELPNDPLRMVTGRTVGLFLDPRDISIDLVMASDNG